MLRNYNNEWFVNYKKVRNNQWVKDQKNGTVWSSRKGPIHAIRHWNLKGQCEIIEYQLFELMRDPK